MNPISNQELRNSMNSIRKQAIKSYIDNKGKRCIIIPRGVSGTPNSFPTYQEDDYILNNIKIIRV